MSHRTAPRLFLIVLAALALFVTSCGGGSSSGDESSASKSSGSSDKADTSKTTKPADDKCPADHLRDHRARWRQELHGCGGLRLRVSAT